MIKWLMHNILISHFVASDLFISVLEPVLNIEGTSTSTPCDSWYFSCCEQIKQKD